MATEDYNASWFHAKTDKSEQYRNEDTCPYNRTSSQNKKQRGDNEQCCARLVRSTQTATTRQSLSLAVNPNEVDVNPDILEEIEDVPANTMSG